MLPTCQGSAGNRTTRRPPDHREETRIKVAWTCLQFISSGQNHLARHSKMQKNLRFADDTDGLAGEEKELANLVERLDKPPQPTAWRSVPRRPR